MLPAWPLCAGRETTAAKAWGTRGSARPAPQSSRTRCGIPRGWPKSPSYTCLPHIERACESLPLEVLGTGIRTDGAFELRLKCTQADAGLGEIRAAFFALLGSFAEPSTYVRQRRVATAEDPEKTLVFEVVTGFLASDTAFAPHGHTVRVSVTKP
jgi:hypothetical protein